ncbi:multidrug resistance protein 1 [Penicillium vulpinum]|uniref:ABC transporter n=1 Tax=Penicillium vulpinum TaxID=29845 RepID=A0A1V6RW63_9EURO|nr:multidrug resistance protein 1 [Penicillium vulpinum]KAJ5959584.1 multidrug resistance protein 1 [Penicillium vulpinum]OQE05734.1 hypothetical protein PENVUL_c022G03654 [Penicillium vulpinum]
MPSRDLGDQQAPVEAGQAATPANPPMNPVGPAPADDDPFKHLPEHERLILKRQLDLPATKVNYMNLYRYATRNDKIVLVLASIAAIIGGALMPMMTILFGGLAGTFRSFLLGDISDNQFTSELGRFSLYFLYLAIGEFFMVYMATVGFVYAGEHITAKIRERFLAAILRQNVAFFDELGAGEITTRITADTNLIQEGISEKVGLTITAIATFVAAFVIGFIRYWKLTLILCSTVVAIVVTLGFVGTFVSKLSRKYLGHFAEGGTVAEEVISSIRNAAAFNTQEKLARRYDGYLIEAEKSGFKLKSTTSSMIGFLFLYIYLNYGLSFWMGSRFLVDGSVGLAQILTIQMAIMMGAFALGNITPNVQAITTAVAAANKIYATIDRVSPLDPLSTEGQKLKKLQGDVELKNIRHIYPSRPEVVVMDDVSLLIPAGKSTALVGASGSGKSTIIGLVERFYDPVGGSVYIDGHDIKDLNLRWLRQQISLVSQEPTLFATTIFGNIKHGLIGTPHEHGSEKAITELVERAARMANAHDFITSLPEGYETDIGERGFLLSGGQKQRIAIARAMVSDPKILLLDEATSALDTKSEGFVQAALDKAAQGRTTVIIAHRLSTIKNANNIVVMSHGRIVEQGTHDELLQKKATYYNLAEAQRIATKQESRNKDDDHILPEINYDLPRVEFHEKRDSLGKLDQGKEPEDPEADKTRSDKSRTALAKKGQKDMTDNYTLFQLIRFVAVLNKQEWKYMIFGILLAIICGGGNPTQAVFFSKCIAALSLPLSESSEIRRQVNFWSLMYLMLAFVQLLALISQGIAFSYCAERLTHRVRDRAFRYILRQDIAYFDTRSAGALTSFLSTETSQLAGLSGITLMTILLLITTLVASCAIGLAVGWKLSLVCISTIPLLLACGYLRLAMLVRIEREKKRAYEDSASYACEATSAIRTVASLTREDDICSHYHEQLLWQGRSLVWSVLKSSILYAASQSLQFLCMALGFWYGGTLFGRHEYTLFQFFLCFSTVIFGAQSAGTIFSFAPDIAKASHAAASVKALFDRTPEIDSWSQNGDKVQSIEGHVEFRDVHFTYPTRPNQPVLRDLNLQVKPGQEILRSSPRRYLRDGKEISSFNINNYRSHLALVSQEPTLYQGTIRENIMLGTDRDDVSEEEMVVCCKNANIYDFIISLPSGFDTLVGSKGSMLSGGQKQRLAIARALLRNPRILLLDEATSALDSESEKLVQAALDTAAKGRTTIAVAHRLSTVQKADMIYVFNQGRIIEGGTHSELMQKRSVYFELVSLQNLGEL